MTKLRAGFVALMLFGGAMAVAPRQAAAQKKPQRDLVTREELLASAQSEQDLYSALRSLRPRFLEPPKGIRSIAGNSVQYPTAVVVDNKPMGGLETLQSIVASTVDEVRYLEPSKAGTEYGDRANGGAVVVKLFKPKATKPKVSVVDSVPAKTPR